MGEGVTDEMTTSTSSSSTTRKRSYVLNDAEVDGSLCDPDSKSLSGYVDITGSKYDAEGEDKHLFYWFFEKRGGDAVHSDATPLILVRCVVFTRCVSNTE